MENNDLSAELVEIFKNKHKFSLKLFKPTANDRCSPLLETVNHFPYFHLTLCATI